VITREQCAALDAVDPLAHFRRYFDLPEGLIYLDGNSLGALPVTTLGGLNDLVANEWGRSLIRGWRDHGWWELPVELGERIGRLVGAAPGQVAVGDSTSVNLFKVLVAALRLRPERRVLVSEAGNFPTDLYLASSAAELLGVELRLVERDPDQLRRALSDEVGAVLLTHVDYRSAAILDMAATTGMVHDAGALMVFDLCHSAGALPVELDATGVDFAVGCTYKYLNGGPGSPAFAYAAARHQASMRQPLTGWGGHARPFDFEPAYEAATGAARLSVGTPSVLSLAPLRSSLEIFERTSTSELRMKSLGLSELLIALLDELDPPGLELASPRAAAMRGSHLAYRCSDARALHAALEEREILGDLRPPDLLRLGIAPLYLRHVDIYDTAVAIAEILGA
jgi:kynureninase